MATEPVTPNKYFVVPATGDLVAGWGTAALNPNFQIIDALFGGVTSISLSGATSITLTVPPSNGSWSGGSNIGQSSKVMLSLSGAQTGSAVITFTLPGFYIINNQCTGTTFVQLAGAVGSTKIGVPQGKKSHVFYDGVNGMDFVNPPDPGTALDLHGWTALPAWMTACSVSPYLIKDGSVYSSSVYPALAAVLGSTFGGNGVSTFGVPDERARMRVALDTVQGGATSARVTFAVAGFTGSLMGASGGDQRLQSHNHGVTDPGHSHPASAGIGVGNVVGAAGGGGPIFIQSDGFGHAVGSASTGISINNNGSGGSQNMPPSIVSHLALIKT